MVRALRRKAGVLVGMYRHKESRRIFIDFIGWVIAKKATGKALGPLPRYADCLQRIDAVLNDGETMSSSRVTNVLSTEDIRRAGLFAMFLSEHGLLVDGAEQRTHASELRRIQRILTEAESTPWSGLIARYADELAEGGLYPRTRRTYLRAALEFQKSSGVARVGQLMPSHVRTFLSSHPGHRASLFPWLTYLRKRAGITLSVPKKLRRKRPTITSQAKTVAGLVSTMRQTDSIRVRRGLTAKLISVLYGAPLVHVLALKRNSVDLSETGVKIQVSGDWVKVDEPVAGLLREVISRAGGAAGSRLFPGRLQGDPLSVAGVDYYLRAILVS